MFNGTSTLGKDNPRWPIGNATETLWARDVGPPPPHGPSLPRVATGASPVAAVAGALRNTTRNTTAWLTSLPRRAGGRLFAKNDTEARWRGWQITELACGLARQYRDPRFNTLPERSGIGGVQAEPDPQPRAGGYIPGVPEAWDDHWNGAS